MCSPSISRGHILCIVLHYLNAAQVSKRDPRRLIRFSATRWRNFPHSSLPSGSQNTREDLRPRWKSVYCHKVMDVTAMPMGQAKTGRCAWRQYMWATVIEASGEAGGDKRRNRRMASSCVRDTDMA